MFKTIIIIIIALYFCKIYITNKLNKVISQLNNKFNIIDKNISETFDNNLYKYKNIDSKKVSKCKSRNKVNLPPIKKTKKKVKLNPIVTVQCDSSYTGYNKESNCYNYLELN